MRVYSVDLAGSAKGFALFQACITSPFQGATALQLGSGAGRPDQGLRKFAVSNRRERKRHTTAQVRTYMLYNQQGHRRMTLLPRSGRRTGVGLLAQDVFPERHTTHENYCTSTACKVNGILQRRYHGQWCYVCDALCVIWRLYSYFVLM